MTFYLWNTCILLTLCAPAAVKSSFNGNPGTGLGPVNIGDTVGFDCQTDFIADLIQITKKTVDNIKTIVAQANNTDQLEYYFDASPSDNRAGFNCKAYFENGTEGFKSGTKWYNVFLSATDLQLTLPSVNSPYDQNENISFMCESNEGLPTPQIVWYKDNQELSSGDVIAMSHETLNGVYDYLKAKSSVTLLTQVAYNGQSLTCSIQNNASVSKSHIIQISFPPEISSLKLSPNSPTGRDEWHSITCSIDGSNPSAVIEWWFDGEKLDGTEPGVEIVPQFEGTVRYNVPAAVGILKILVEEDKNGKVIECWPLYNGNYLTELSKSHIIEIKVPTNIFLYIGPAVGGTLLIVLIITIIIVCSHRKGRSKPTEETPSTEEEDDKYEYILESSNSGFDKEFAKENINMKPSVSKENTYVTSQSTSTSSDTYTSSGVGLQSLSQLDLTTTVSEGAYANIKCGNPKHGSGLYLHQKVVAKVLRGSAKSFHRQILQSQLHALYVVKKHENILQFVSFIENKKTLAIITEFYDVGDLQHFLRIQDNSQNISSRDLIGMARDVANGMKYLTTHQPPFLHHQLSTKHVLIGPRLVCKVFGFALEDSVRERDRFELKYKLPVDIRWKAPELLAFNQQHSVYSDVWSFGVMLYEVASLGNNPYPGLSDDNAIRSYVLDQQIMSRPVFISSTIYDLMRHCWSWDPMSRPSFASVTSELDYLQTDTQLHIDISTLMHPSISGHLRGHSRKY